MERVTLSETLELSRIVAGAWRLDNWGFNKENTLDYIKDNIEMGITSFDNADIYGFYTCEDKFGEALELDKGIREKIEIITKCGIGLPCDGKPEIKVPYYDSSKKHIISSVENSLKNFRTDYIDLLLIHRPDFLMDPSDVAEAFNKLHKEGKVLNFGVSNFKPSQVSMLSSFLEMPLVTNQVEISVGKLDSFIDGTLDQCLERDIKPMAWSPLVGGRVFTSDEDKFLRLRNTLEEVKENIGASSIDEVMYSFLLKHPSKILPIAGSSKLERIKLAVNALDLHMEVQDWYKIWQSSTGRRID